MTNTISVRLDKGLQKAISIVELKWKADRSEVIRRLLARAVKTWKIDNAIDEINNRKISVGKAAEECEITIWELIEILKKKNTDWTGYSEEDIKKDLEILN